MGWARKIAVASRCDGRAAFQAPVWYDLPAFKTGAILLIPIHFVYRAARARALGVLCVSEVFETVDAIRKCSFKEVTDETRGTGQRKFARWWYRAADRNFSSGGTVDQDGRSQRRRELLFPRHTRSTGK